jgi:hypothetical protein
MTGTATIAGIQRRYMRKAKTRKTTSTKRPLIE